VSRSDASAYVVPAEPELGELVPRHDGVLVAYELLKGSRVAMCSETWAHRRSMRIDAARVRSPAPTRGDDPPRKATCDPVSAFASAEM